MAEGVPAGIIEADVNITGNQTQIAMAYLQDEVTVYLVDSIAFLEGTQLNIQNSFGQ